MNDQINKEPSGENLEETLTNKSEDQINQTSIAHEEASYYEPPSEEFVEEELNNSEQNQENSDENSPENQAFDEDLSHDEPEIDTEVYDDTSENEPDTEVKLDQEFQDDVDPTEEATDSSNDQDEPEEPEEFLQSDEPEDIDEDNDEPQDNQEDLEDQDDQDTEEDLEEECPFELEKLAGIIEALVFVSGDPVPVKRLVDTLEIKEKFIRNAIDHLSDRYIQTESGVQIMEVAGGFQMRTRTFYSNYVNQFLERKKKVSLSSPALETIAIIAYKQPITRAEVEAIRGVAVDGVLKSLLDKRLIKVTGVKEVPGKPNLYGTTKHFLEYFGLNSIKDLPAIDDITKTFSGGAAQLQDEPNQEIQNESQEKQETSESTETKTSDTQESTESSD